jgi:hypothetical protein
MPFKWIRSAETKKAKLDAGHREMDDEDHNFPDPSRLHMSRHRLELWLIVLLPLY